MDRPRRRRRNNGGESYETFWARQEEALRRARRGPNQQYARPVRPGEARRPARCRLPPVTAAFTAAFNPPNVVQGGAWRIYLGPNSTAARAEEPNGRDGILTVEINVHELNNDGVDQGTDAYDNLDAVIRYAVAQFRQLPRGQLCERFTQVSVQMAGTCEDPRLGLGGNPGDLDVPNFMMTQTAQQSSQGWHGVRDDPCGNVGSPGFRHITQVIVRFIVRVPAGGCLDGKHPQVMRIEGMKLRNLPAVRNNCFFKACRYGLDLEERYSPAQCNDLRQRYGLDPDAEVPAHVALQIADEVFRKKVSIVHKVGDIGFESYGCEPEEADVKLFLWDGHYYVFEGQYKVCEHCNKTYLNKHTCNENVADYYNRKVCHNLGTKPLPEEELLDREVMHYDIETYRDPVTNRHIPYILGAVYYRHACNTKVYLTFEGARCIPKFYDFLLSDEVKHVKVVNAYNGSRFDHYFLFAEELERVDKKIGRFILSNGRILSATVAGKRLFDLNQHITGSLARNLKENRCSVAKGEIDHNLSVAWEDTAPERREQVMEYLQCDVVGLCELYEKINSVMHGNFKINISRFVTSSSMCYKLWTSRFLGGVRIRLPDPEFYEVCRQAIYGGRCYPTKRSFVSTQLDQVQAGALDYAGVTDYLYDADIVSMYPFCMQHFAYPVGNYRRWSELWRIPDGVPVWTLPGGQKVPDCLGIFYISYTPPPGLVSQPVLPKKTVGRGLSWDLLPGEGWFTSVDIGNALIHGYKVQVHNGYYWQQKGRVFKDYVDYFYDAKRNAAKGSAAYTSAKINLNALYGKQLQRKIDDTEHIIRCADDFWELSMTNRITCMREVKANRWVVNCVPLDPTKRTPDKPTFLGCFVLSYSRALASIYYDRLITRGMTQQQQIHSMPFYMDTDSFVIRSDYVHLIGVSNELGGVTNDVDGKILEAYFVAPKLYAFKYLTPQGEIKFHLRGKGVANEKLEFAHMRSMALEGASFVYHRDFQMKRHHLGKSKLPAGYDVFSIQHIDAEHTGRELNTKPWEGRQWYDGYSMPHGFKHE